MDPQSRSVEHYPQHSYTHPSLYYGRIILGEIPPLLSAVKRTIPRWSSSQQDLEQDPLVLQLRGLQMTITHLKTDATLEPNTFLDPFLAVIRSEDTTGPVTRSALAAVNRMLCYGLIDPRDPSAAAAVESVAAAVTHARFVGTDQGADEVVLWEILSVLRTLILSPVGHLLTNESVCEILNSSFRICFETRLSELLRNCTEDTLRHMVQLLFARLPQFKNDPQIIQNSSKLKMRAGSNNGFKEKEGKRSQEVPLTSPCDQMSIPSTDTADREEKPPVENYFNISEKVVPLADPEEPENALKDDSSYEESTSSLERVDVSHAHLAPESAEDPPVIIATEGDPPAETDNQLQEVIAMPTAAESEKETLKEEFINLQGVKFTQDDADASGKVLVPYSLPCVREVFRFLISLTSPRNTQNTPNMIHTALNLLTVALEVGVEHINNIPSLLSLIKNQLCRNVFMLITEDAKLPSFMAALRVCTLLFESLRIHLKFQMEMFISKLTNIIASESASVLYFYRELSLETIVQLWHIPGLITELFLNFDCNLYSSNVFEDLTKLLSKNAFPVQGLYSTNLLSLEALLTVIDVIDSHYPQYSKKKEREKNRCAKQEVTHSRTVSTTTPIAIPVSSGYLLGLRMLMGHAPLTPMLRARSCITGDKDISRETLLAVKEKKKLLVSGTSQFNAKPEKGIQFLQNHGIIDQTNEDIALFVKENPHLDKKVIGDFVSKKKNVGVLSAFVKSFNFTGLRIDECLRIFLEAFRLPGEAPLISIIIEHFSSHWHSSNGYSFEKDDAAFTLAYAVIMLNVDQHNQNAKKQNIPMTLDQFTNNLRGVNGGKDFDKKMLEEIYCAIHSDEIVMPAEQTGPVKENYEWKLLLKRENSTEGEYILTNGNNCFDKDLFALCWGPTIASLSYVFDKSVEDAFLQKAISGFKKCASIAARYSMSDVFDNLIVSLIKFTTLTVSSNDSPEQAAICFGENIKAQLAARTLFRLVTTHGDNLRDGWKNIVELLLQLFKCRILCSSLTESEDFVESSGKVKLQREMPINIPRTESGIFSSLYSYIALGDSGVTKGLSPEEVILVEKAKFCIEDCHPEKLLTESAFLRYDSLNELLKAMIGAGDASSMAGLAVTHNFKSPNGGANAQEVACGLDEYSQAFLLELVISVLIANKDRAGGIWPSIRDHIYSLLMGAAAVERYFLLERCIVAVLRIAKVLLRRPELANPILQSLRMLLLLRPVVLKKASLQIVSGIYEILSVNADHIQDPSDWAILFALMECSGAGAKPPPIVNPDDCAAEIDTGSSRTPVNDVEQLPNCGLAETESATQTSSPRAGSSPKLSRGPSPETIQNPGGWILVGKEGEIEPIPVKSISVNEWDIVHLRVLGEHKPESLLKAVDTLAFLVRERHITAASLPYVVQTCRTFVEATLNGAVKLEKKPVSKEEIKSHHRHRASRKKEDKASTSKSPKSPTSRSVSPEAEGSDFEEIPISYQQVSEKLLDLMDTLHTSSSHILQLKGEEESSAVPNLHSRDFSISLWHQSLCPLLQGIARYCCDQRNTIRNLALTYLQRALLNHDLQTLTAVEWESCFNKVLFPLLAKLLQSLGEDTTNGAMEETRVRAATLVQKVYLRHLTPLLSLPTFTALWLTILDFMDKFLNTHKSDNLSDAIPEILKNMLLVMETTQVFHTSEGFTHLWSITWDRIDAFLPNFRHELFKSHPPSEIHRIEVIPSENVEALERPPSELVREVSPENSSNNIKENDGPDQGLSGVDRQDDSVEKVPLSSLKEQEAVRLSLSQESLPDYISTTIILQPPLPHILPVPSPPASPIHSEVTCHQHSTLLHQDLSSSFASLPRFVPPTTTASDATAPSTSLPSQTSPSTKQDRIFSSSSRTTCSPDCSIPASCEAQHTSNIADTSRIPSCIPDAISSTEPSNTTQIQSDRECLGRGDSASDRSEEHELPASQDLHCINVDSESVKPLPLFINQEPSSFQYRPASLLFSQSSADDFPFNSNIKPFVPCTTLDNNTCKQELASEELEPSEVGKLKGEDFG